MFFKKSLTFIFIATSLTWTCGATEKKTDLVIVLGDDHGVYDSSAYGSLEMQTPNMQAMANEGMLFHRAYVASPSCGPSRAALGTGLMPYRNGVVGNHENTRLKKDVKGLYQNLIDAGYDVVFKGKIAHGKSKKTRYLSDKITYLDGAQKKMKLGNVDAYLAARTEKSKPIALFIGPTDTHLPWPKPKTARIAINDVVVPPKTFDNQATRSVLSAYVESVENVDRILGGVRTLVNKHLDPNNTLLMYSSDHGKAWPFGKWSVYETGIRTPLLVVWPGKIGANTQTQAMVSWVDILPTLIDIAGGKAEKNIDGKSFKKVLTGESDKHHNLIFATHKGDKNQNVYPSRSVRNEQWKYILNLHPEFYHTTHADKKNRHANWDAWDADSQTNQVAAQFVINYRARPAEELYLVGSDPYEEHNLAYDPRYKDVLKTLRKTIEERMISVNDDKSLTDRPFYLKDVKLPAAIKVYYPNGNETLASHSPVTIRWNATWQGTKIVKIEYYNGEQWHVISSTAPHSGSYEWTVPKLSSTKIRIRISANQGRIFDESDNTFSITK
jgi:uncharacterized sulfatase